MKRMNSQQGQALVLIALAAVALFGFTALAVDGSRLFSDRRHAQNAADTAALSAALSKIRAPGNDAAKFAAAVTAARNIAASNGYNNNGTSNTVDVSLCSDSGVSCPALPAGADPTEYLQVKIVSTIPSTFARIFGRPFFTSTSVAVVRAAASTTSTSGGGGTYGITALKQNGTGMSFNGHGPVDIEGGVADNSAFEFNGSGTVNVTGPVQVGGSFAHNGSGSWNVGGSVWVNGFTKIGSQNWHVIGDFFSNGTFSQTGAGDFTAASFTSVGDASKTGSGAVAPWPRTAGTYQTPPVIPDPFASALNPPANPGNCTTIDFGGSTNHTIGPGCYNSITQRGNGNLTLSPGIYYILGDFDMGGGGDLIAHGVMIYMKGGSLSLSGNGNLDVTPMTSGTYKGLSVYMDRANSNPISISGSSSSSFTGTVYAPASAYTANGSGGTFVMDSQIICFSAELKGTGGLTLNFDPSNNYVPPPLDGPAIQLNQ